MDLLQPLVDLFNLILGSLGSILDLIERIVSPITNLIERWTNLFPASE